MKDPKEQKNHRTILDGITLSMKKVIKDLTSPHPAGIPLIIISLVFFVSFFLAPILAEKDTIDLGHEGSVGEKDHDETISDINSSYSRSVYRFGDRYCHQKDHRSWSINGNQMPVCARDVGLFLGLFMGCIFGASYRKGIPLRVLLGLLVPMAIDGGFQAITSYESFNLLRLITGVIGGFGVGAYVNGSLVHTVILLLYKGQKG